MAAPLRRLVPLLAGLAVAFAPAAVLAHDYIVVGSTDATFSRGQSFDGGARVPLAPGRTLTLMHASGDIVRVQGAAGGVLLPKRTANPADADRLAILRAMVTPAAKQMLATRTRGGLCPDAGDLTSLDAIVQVQAGGCKAVAREALSAWLAARNVEEPTTP